MQHAEKQGVEGGVKWREFNFSDVFYIKKGFYNKKPPCMGDGRLPFIGATDSNNGFTGFTTRDIVSLHSKTGSGKNEPIEQKIFDGNAICVTNNGSVGYAYYQQHSFTCSHDVNPLYLRERKLNKYIALYLITCIENQRLCFTYARKWRPVRMFKSRLMLPVDNLGNPYWLYMENISKLLEAKMLGRYLKYALSRLSNS